MQLKLTGSPERKGTVTVSLKVTEVGRQRRDPQCMQCVSVWATNTVLTDCCFPVWEANSDRGLGRTWVLKAQAPCLVNSLCTSLVPKSCKVHTAGFFCDVYTSHAPPHSVDNMPKAPYHQIYPYGAQSVKKSPSVNWCDCTGEGIRIFQVGSQGQFSLIALLESLFSVCPLPSVERSTWI